MQSRHIRYLEAIDRNPTIGMLAGRLEFTYSIRSRRHPTRYEAAAARADRVTALVDTLLYNRTRGVRHLFGALDLAGG
ncbi:hypothetical protein D5S18_22560 [Nocardia panacis]|uniref:Uncharacterized protein n=1 Tax=Nocardia panacis TaxID=2340916 RepID=A0A3A4KBQ0_9NOCA|nr:hypothetical protein D5S18_22560 [Nocardia panacis]